MNAAASVKAVAPWQGCRGLFRLIACAVLTLAVLLPGLAHAIEAMPVQPDNAKIDITAKGELYEGRGDRLQIETAPGSDGYIGRMAVQASTPGTNPGWLVFALFNPTDKRIVRWLVAPRYTLANSRVLRPELDAPRIREFDKESLSQKSRLRRRRASCFGSRRVVGLEEDRRFPRSTEVNRLGNIIIRETDQADHAAIDLGNISGLWLST